MHDVTAQIVVVAETFAMATGLRITTVSTRCAGQAYAVERLRTGHSITVRRAGRIMQWLSDHWPAGADWPEGIARPAPSPGSPASGPADEAEAAEDPVARVRALRAARAEAQEAAGRAGSETEAARRFGAAGRLQAEMLRVALRLDPRTGELASPAALLAATGAERREYDYVVGRYRDGRGGGRPRAEMARLLLKLLVASGDGRFAARREAA